MPPEAAPLKRCRMDALRIQSGDSLAQRIAQNGSRAGFHEQARRQAIIWVYATHVERRSFGIGSMDGRSTSSTGMTPSRVPEASRGKQVCISGVRTRERLHILL